MKKRLTLLIDADIIAFKYALVNQKKNAFWSEGMDEKDRIICDWDRAVRDMDKYIENLIETLEATDVIMAISCKTADGFRKNLVKESYKSNRADTERPVMLEDLKQYLLDNYPSKRKPYLEGDDILGILHTRDPNHSIMCTIDKDMNTIPGKVYNWDHPEWGIVETSEEEAWRFFYKQVLTGDTVDGYKGCPQIGPTRADEAIGWIKYDEYFHHNIWRAVVCQYQMKGLKEEDALKEARMARILQKDDYDYENQEPILWSPPITKEGKNKV